MNEQINDLMYRAGLTAQGCWDSMDDYDRETILKFAELIVRECVNQCEKNIAGMVGSHASAHNSAVQKCMNSITEHFGIL